MSDSFEELGIDGIPEGIKNRTDEFLDLHPAPGYNPAEGLAAAFRAHRERTSLPSGPAEEFTQTPGNPRIVDFSGLSGPPLFGDTHPPVTELAAEVLRGSDPDSENIKGPTPHSDKSPRPFYSHNDAEITRLRAVVDSYRVRLQRLRDQITEALRGLEDLQ